MRSFWALPAVLRIALASQHAFSVFDDLLAFPQYEVDFPNSFIVENDASSLLSQSASRSTPSTSPKSEETQELSKAGKPSPSPESPNAVLEKTYEALVLDGQRYLCSIPIIPDEEPVNATASKQAKVDEEKELMRATDRGWELLAGMQGSCIYYLSGWWSYSFCYKDKIKQFHQLPPSRGVPLYPPVEDTTEGSFVLGRFPQVDDAKGKEKGKGKGKKRETQKTLGNEEGSKEVLDEKENVKSHDVEVGSTLEVAKLVTKGGSTYMVQKLSGGTECDLTGKERKIEVQFHCNPSSGDKIGMIKETATCAYLMVIYTNRLCHDVAFLPVQENLAHPISCQPVISESERPAWELRQIEEDQRDRDRLLAIENENPLREMTEGADGATKRRPTIGGIEVGAKILVGSEGKVIEKSVIAGGGKEVYVGTVADSAGNQMSVAEMKKLNINDPKDVEELKKNLKEYAGERGWKLDLVDTPRGRQFRGVIEVEGEGDEEEVKAKAKKVDAKAKAEKAEKGEKGEKGASKGMKKQGEGTTAKKGAKKEVVQEEDEFEAGSEEVYKDEL
ncbi:glucosidase II beta subunit-like protein-domain-containing protein [Dendryphion nanum]|uniref:Endoplasmic reticulum lectin n=1 Tax=Dendryphion nanum TaxID=256645 RepID=A0A9P9DT96_9PLEO|nr:glucosidase II beta subunit-like protein-domain-containing protein [Dendryphion nanum]